MDIKIVGKTTGTVGLNILKVRGLSGKKYQFNKEAGVGHICRSVSKEDTMDIFSAQNARLAYYFMPLFTEKDEEKTEFSFDTENMSLEELKEVCDKLGIDYLPQDRERSLRRCVEAYVLGSNS